MDKDLIEKRGLWDNIWAKRKRIAAGSGERMRKPGEKGAPSEKDLKSAQESYTGAEPTSSNTDEPANRFVGTDTLVNNYKEATPGQSTTLKTIKKVVREQLEEEYYACENCTCGFAEEYIAERGADSKGYYRSTESGAGLTAKGAKHFGVGTAVTEKNPKGKRAARRKSFCARMGGMKGPMKDEKGRPTRKAMSLRRWRC